MGIDYVKIPGEHGSFTVKPMPSTEQLATFYRDEYYQTSASATYSPEYSERELQWKRLKSDFAVYLMQRRGTVNGKFIDLGCGEGFLVDAALRAGFDAYGVDFSSYAVERFHPHLRRRVMSGDVFQTLGNMIASRQYYKVCTMQHLVEHVRDPQELLNKVQAILEIGGIALVTVPNDENPIQHLAMQQGHIEDEFWFTPPQHLHYFNTRSAPALAQSAGFEVIDVVTDFPIDLFLMHPGSNYVRLPETGKHAHRVRVDVELLIAREGLERLRALGVAQAQCGLGRDLTMILRKN